MNLWIKDMKFLDFFKQKANDRSPKEIISNILEFSPELYKTHRQFKNCIEFFDNRELGLALESLIELAEETGHYFSDHFWSDLSIAAEEMSMNEQAQYCNLQIKRNLEEIKWKIPFGSTVLKIDDTHFEHYYSQKLKDQWAAERRIKDGVGSFKDIDGVHLKSHGRNGFVYFVEKGRIAEIEYELGTKGLIIWLKATDSWYFPNKQILTSNEKQNIKNSITDWAVNTKNAIEFE